MLFHLGDNPLFLVEQADMQTIMAFKQGDGAMKGLRMNDVALRQVPATPYPGLPAIIFRETSHAEVG